MFNKVLGTPIDTFELELIEKNITPDKTYVYLYIKDIKSGVKIGAINFEDTIRLLARLQVAKNIMKKENKKLGFSF